MAKTAETKLEEVKTLVAGMHHGLFATLTSIEEAQAFLDRMAHASSDPTAIMVSVHVMLNTLVAKIESILQE